MEDFLRMWRTTSSIERSAGSHRLRSSRTADTIAAACSVEYLFLFPLVQKKCKKTPRNTGYIVKNKAARFYGSVCRINCSSQPPHPNVAAFTQLTLRMSARLCLSVHLSYHNAARHSFSLSGFILVHFRHFEQCFHAVV